MLEELRWKKFTVLNDGFVTLVDAMGSDASIAQAARVSYGNDARSKIGDEATEKDRELIRYLMRHKHTSPFEMAEVIFHIRIPMDAWRQMVRHRTASINEYSTRYKEAIDSQQVTAPDQWRLQATDNKQGSSGFLPASTLDDDADGEVLTVQEATLHMQARKVYQRRLEAGIAKEQARKDLPLSTYTEARWKCDLHNIFHFLQLRLDKHAQLEIRQYAEAIANIVKQLFPAAYEAFEDYRLNTVTLSSRDIAVIRHMQSLNLNWGIATNYENLSNTLEEAFPNKRERTECLNKLKELGFLVN